MLQPVKEEQQEASCFSPLLHAYADAKRSKLAKQDSGNSASVWDRLRRLLPGSAKGSTTSALEPEPSPAEGDSQCEQHSDFSSSGMSKNTSGPLQFLYSRGSKVVAALALLGSRGKQAHAARSSDKAESAPVETQPQDRDSSKRPSSGAADHPGNDTVSKYGAGQPQQATGCQVYTPCSSVMSVGCCWTVGQQRLCCAVLCCAVLCRAVP